MGTSFGRAVIYGLQAIAPQKQTEHINIWKYDAPEYFLRPVRTWRPDPFVLEKAYSETPSHEFEIRYFSKLNENPIKDSLPISISTRKKQVVVLCGLTVELAAPQDAKRCIDKWVFSRRRQGGFYIKPFNDPLLCINAYRHGIRVETCRSDWPSMSFMYGDKTTRQNFLILRDLVEITHDPGTKRELKDILDSGEYMYESTLLPQELDRNTQILPAKVPSTRSNPPGNDLHYSNKHVANHTDKTVVKRYRKPTDMNPHTDYREIYHRPKNRMKYVSQRSMHESRPYPRRIKRTRRRIRESDDPYIRKSTLLKYMEKMSSSQLDSSVINRLKEVVSAPSPLYNTSHRRRNKEVDTLLHRLDLIQQKAQDSLLDSSSCDLVFCP